MWYTFCAKPMILIDRIVTLRCRSPCGERGLKYLAGVTYKSEDGRSPCGERGLKYDLRHTHASTLLSLPVRGAWVEILFLES